MVSENFKGAAMQQAWRVPSSDCRWKIDDDRRGISKRKMKPSDMYEYIEKTLSYR